MRVGVLRGGRGHEYDVSLRSGASVLKNLPSKYKARDVLITKDGTWHVDGLPIAPANLTKKIDVAVNALHGEFGEDGQVQRLLDQYRIPYTGSGHFASAVGMNKLLTKELLLREGLKTPLYWVVDDGDDLVEMAGIIFRKLPPPWIVKPVDRGSSIGVRLVMGARDLPEAMASALASSGGRILVEEFIRGKEATCGVVENFRNRSCYPLLPAEVCRPASAPLGYEEKYGGNLRLVCPGTFLPAEKDAVQDLAARVHELLGLRHYSRTDFIVSRRGIYVLEVNTLPGLETGTFFPQALEAVGCGYGHFLDHVLALALGR